MAEALTARVPVFSDAALANEVNRLDNPTEVGGPLVFLVKTQQPASDAVEVYLPVRPNGSTGWVNDTDVRLVENAYRIKIDLSDHRLTLYERNVEVLIEPVGLGKADVPTPGGIFFIKELLQPPNPHGPYGPYAYGLSGFSTVLTDFAGGDGVIGIHGTNDPSSVGKDSSHGCIRMHNDAIKDLVAVLPLGTPVEILA